MEKFNIDYIEQPLPAEALEDLAELRYHTDIPIAVDESLTDFQSAEKIIEEQAADVFIIKPRVSGGFTECKKIINLARKENIRTVITSSFETAIGRSACLHLTAANEITEVCGLATGCLLSEDKPSSLIQCVEFLEENGDYVCAHGVGIKFTTQNDLPFGEIASVGPTKDIIEKYIQSNEEISKKQISDRLDRSGNGIMKFKKLELIDNSGREIEFMRTGDSLSFLISYEARNKKSIKNVSIRILIVDRMDRLITQFWSKFTGQDFKEIPPEGSFICKAKRFGLSPGDYWITIKAFVNNDLSDKINFSKSLKVKSGDFFNKKRSEDFRGIFVADQDWELKIPEVKH